MLKKIFKWRNGKQQKKMEQKHQSWISQPYISIIEHIIFWRSAALSLTIMVGTNLVFFVCVNLQIRLLGLLFGLALMAVTLGTIIGRRSLSFGFQPQKDNESTESLNLALRRAQQWLGYQMMQLKELREQNRDKFCLVMCLLWSGLVVLGGVLSGSTLVYLTTQGALLLPVALPYMCQAMHYIKQNADSDGDMESFMPEMSVQALAELEQADAPMQTYSQEQSIEKWIPAGCIPGDDSDSNSDEISVFTSTVGAPVELTDSSGSSDDEFTPHSMPSHIEDQQLLLKSSVNIVHPAVNSWSVSGLAKLGALGNLGVAFGAWWPGPALTAPTHTKHKLIRSDSDDFEIIDKDDFNTQ